MSVLLSVEILGDLVLESVYYKSTQKEFSLKDSHVGFIKTLHNL